MSEETLLLSDKSQRTCQKEVKFLPTCLLLSDKFVEFSCVDDDMTGVSQVNSCPDVSALALLLLLGGQGKSRGRVHGVRGEVEE